MKDEGSDDDSSFFGGGGPVAAYGGGGAGSSVTWGGGGGGGYSGGGSGQEGGGGGGSFFGEPTTEITSRVGHRGDGLVMIKYLFMEDAVKLIGRKNMTTQQKLEIGYFERDPFEGGKMETEALEKSDRERRRKHNGDREYSKLQRKKEKEELGKKLLEGGNEARAQLGTGPPELEKRPKTPKVKVIKRKDPTGVQKLKQGADAQSYVSNSFTAMGMGKVAKAMHSANKKFAGAERGLTPKEAKTQPQPADTTQHDQPADVTPDEAPPEDLSMNLDRSLTIDGAPMDLTAFSLAEPSEITDVFYAESHILAPSQGADNEKYTLEVRSNQSGTAVHPQRSLNYSIATSSANRVANREGERELQQLQEKEERRNAYNPIYWARRGWEELFE